jgi:tetraacyldisaccharide 4'-kinase
LNFFINIISGQSQGIFASAARGILYVASVLWKAIIVCRNWLYDSGLKKPIRLPAKVLGIGNITAGGTGKTPCAIAIAKEQSLPLAIVLRSYKTNQIDPIEVFLDTPVSLAGDEALVIKRQLPWAIVCVAKDKSKAAELAIKKGAKTVLVDDSFQHRKLFYDEEIVIIDSHLPFGYGYLLPRGLLREPLSGLKRASLLVINCRLSLGDTSEIEKTLRHYSKAPIVKALIETSGIFDLNDVSVTQNLKGVPIGLFCGIGNPKQFADTVKQLGVEIVGSLFFQDHEYSQTALDRFCQEMKGRGVKALLCTEKDRVKIQKEVELPVFWLKSNFQFLSHEA